jgi:hypothetical protein
VSYYCNAATAKCRNIVHPQRRGIAMLRNHSIVMPYHRAITT